jgi:hypothetical protein
MSAETVYYTAEQAAAKLGKTRNWMMTKARHRLIPHTRVGRTPMWTDEHLAEIVRMGERRPRLAAKPALQRGTSAKGALRSKPTRRLQASA